MCYGDGEFVQHVCIYSADIMHFIFVAFTIVQYSLLLYPFSIYTSLEVGNIHRDRQRARQYNALCVLVMARMKFIHIAQPCLMSVRINFLILYPFSVEYMCRYIYISHQIKPARYQYTAAQHKIVELQHGYSGALLLLSIIFSTRFVMGTVLWRSMFEMVVAVCVYFE